MFWTMWLSSSVGQSAVTVSQRSWVWVWVGSQVFSLNPFIGCFFFTFYYPRHRCAGVGEPPPKTVRFVDPTIPYTNTKYLTWNFVQVEPKKDLIHITRTIKIQPIYNLCIKRHSIPTIAEKAHKDVDQIQSTISL